jgi:hypothetical protein
VEKRESLEGNAQPQSHRTAIVDTLLAKTADQATKIVIARYVSRGDRQDFERGRVDTNSE